MGVAGSDAARFHLRGARGIDVEAGRQRAVGRIANFETIEEILSVRGARTGDVQVVEVILNNFRQRNQALLQAMGARDGNIANVLRREGGTLGGILDVDLIRGSDNLHLLVELLGVVKSEGDVIEPGMEGNLLARKKKEAFLANLRFVVARRKVAESETPGPVGLGSMLRFAGECERHLSRYDW